MMMAMTIGSPVSITSQEGAGGGCGVTGRDAVFVGGVDGLDDIGVTLSVELKVVNLLYFMSVPVKKKEGGEWNN